jgi:hypothetical protein
MCTIINKHLFRNCIAHAFFNRFFFHVFFSWLSHINTVLLSLCVLPCYLNYIMWLHIRITEILLQCFLPQAGLRLELNTVWIHFFQCYPLRICNKMAYASLIWGTPYLLSNIPWSSYSSSIASQVLLGLETGLSGGLTLLIHFVMAIGLFDKKQAW